MKQEKILDALSLLDDEMLQAVDKLRKTEQQYKKKSNRSWLKWGALAACLCLVAYGAKVWNGSLRYASDSATGAAETEEATTEAITTEAEADMIAFFIYQGNMYEQYDFVEGEELVGAYVGTADGEINEWSEEGAYVELAGSISGDFYEVNGFDPSFMLCMKQDDGTISTYINADGLALETGADLFEDCIHLAGNYQTVQYQTREDWYYSSGEPKTIPSDYAETVSGFVMALNDGEIVAAASMPLEEGDQNIYDREIYHMYFLMENGMNIHLRLFEEGYVRFQGIRDACVLVEENAFKKMTQVLEEVQ